MTFSIWQSPDCYTLAPGRDIPAEAVKVHEFEAPSHDAAHVIYEAFLRRATATHYQACAMAQRR